MNEEATKKLIYDIIDKYKEIYWDSIADKNGEILEICNKYFDEKGGSYIYMTAEIIFHCLIECVSRGLSFFPIEHQRKAIENMHLLLNHNIDIHRDAYLRFQSEHFSQLKKEKHE